MGVVGWRAGVLRQGGCGLDGEGDRVGGSDVGVGARTVRFSRRAIRGNQSTIALGIYILDWILLSADSIEGDGCCVLLEVVFLDARRMRRLRGAGRCWRRHG